LDKAQDEKIDNLSVAPNIKHENIEYKILLKKEDSSVPPDESFSWMDDSPSNNYICLCTKEKANFNEGEQIYNCYGERTNKFLLIK
jgi:hypothetical protein